MILKMEKLSVFGLLEDRDKLLARLMKGSCVQMTPAEEMDNFAEIQPLTNSGEVKSYELEQKLSRFTAAVAAMNFYAAKKGLFAFKPRLPFDKLDDQSMLAQAERQCGEIERITGEIAEQRAARSRDCFTLASLLPWAELDLDVELTSTRTVSVLYYLLPARADLDALQEACRELAVLLQEMGEDREQKYLAAIAHQSDEGALWELLKTYGATRMSFSGLTGTVSENIARLDGRITEVDDLIAGLEDQLREIGKDIFALQYGVDALGVQVQQARAGIRLRSTEKTFCFTGWVPEVNKEKAVNILEEFGCYYELRQPLEDEEPPILLQNNAWATNYEAVTDMYSPPAYRGFDPNMIMSIFFFVFFGMMLSDAGFGLVLFFGGMWLGKKMDLGPGGKKLVNVIKYGGLSAVFWGTIFGSWFGDLFEVVALEFFGKEITMFQPIDPLQDAVLVMGLSCAFGFVHILVGLGIKAYMLVKAGKAMDAVFDIGFWYLILIGLVSMLVSVLGVGGDTLMTVGSVMAAAGAVGVILTGGRDKKNPLMRIGSGITGLYDISGYLSDVLSYSRILALGLATGVIAQVFNIMGTLAGGGILGVIVFIPVFAIGTALNLGINSLGAYVHTARLQYVEFFGKFYEAGGKPFRPFSPETKYVVVDDSAAGANQ